jgi:hypothetical protein
MNIRNNSNLSLALASIAIVLAGCCKEEKSSLKGCCNNPAIELEIGDARIYVPNVFTPNGDAINDFLPVYGYGIKRINSIEVRNQDRDLVFSSQDVVVNVEATSWDGRINGDVVQGLYSVSLNIETDDGIIQLIEGEVCNYPCDDIAPDELVSSQQCQFGDQVNGEFRYDPTIPTAERLEICFTN